MNLLRKVAGPGQSPDTCGIRSHGSGARSFTIPEVPKLLFLRVGPEIVDFWGRNGHLPPQNPSAQVGGFAPDLR